ncbi:MAG TPA: NADH-quinone oxidoreductase subunit C [Thermoplasmatales archaeon]|nr:NADH-quinone oxidoreductase subunit C [Thermoplasmatales archaeon]
MSKKLLTPEELVKDLKQAFKSKIKDAKIERRAVGVKKKERTALWLKADKESLHDIVKHLKNYDYPHLAVVSGNDLGKTIELIYHFTVYYGNPLQEILINISVELPKEKPAIPTITDIIPGALVTEREKQEMLGVKIEGIPDGRRIFLPDDFPEDVYPWRKDEKGPQKMVRDLYEVKK